MSDEKNNLPDLDENSTPEQFHQVAQATLANTPAWDGSNESIERMKALVEELMQSWWGKENYTRAQKWWSAARMTKTIDWPNERSVASAMRGLRKKWVLIRRRFPGEQSEWVLLRMKPIDYQNPADVANAKAHAVDIETEPAHMYPRPQSELQKAITAVKKYFRARNKRKRAKRNG